jgi:NADH dehydrogenase
MVLVVDASSKPGQALIPILIQKGYPVRAFVRDACKLQYAQSLGVEVIEGDIRQPGTLLRVCEGAEAVVSSADTAGSHLLIDVAKKCGVRHFICLSSYRAASDASVRLWHVESQMEEHLKTSGLEYTILQPTAFMDIWCTLLGMQVLKGQQVRIFGDGRNLINFVSAQDVAKFIVFALEDPRLCNQTLTIGGPQNLSLEDVISVYEKVFSTCVARKYTSTRQMKLMSFLYALFDRTQARRLAFQYELATSDWQVDMTETIKHYPINLTKLEDWVLETTKQ